MKPFSQKIFLKEQPIKRFYRKYYKQFSNHTSDFSDFLKLFSKIYQKTSFFFFFFSKTLFKLKTIPKINVKLSSNYL